MENAGKQFSLEFLPGLGLYIYPVQYICHKKQRAKLEDEGSKCYN